MATIQDIFDWLNQGAQGDIPGTGGEQPNAPAASQGVQTAGDVIAPEFRQGMPQNDQSQLNDQWPGGGPFNWGALPLGPHLVTPQQPTPSPMSPGKPANEASDQPPGATPASEQKGYQAGQKAGQGLWAMLFGKQPQKTPGDYSGSIPPSLLGHYNALVQSGLPPDVAHSILTQPSMGEGEDTLATALHTWPYPYAGSQQEYQSAQQSPPSYQSLWDQLMTPPTYEDQ